MSNNNIKIWDIFVRIFHWALVIAFAVAYITEDDYEQVHVYAGYTILGLLVFRILWGFVGSEHARFRSFIVKPSVTLSYLKSIKNKSAERYLGHNPAGAMMVMALMFSLMATVLLGLMLYGAEEFSGPLAFLMENVSKSTAHTIEELHEFFANFTLFLIVIHVLGVLSASHLHKENLTASMVHGNKKPNQEQSS